MKKMTENVSPKHSARAKLAHTPLIPKNLEKAAHWFTEAANRCNGYAQYANNFSDFWKQQLPDYRDHH